MIKKWSIFLLIILASLASFWQVICGPEVDGLKDLYDISQGKIPKILFAYRKNGVNQIYTGQIDGSNIQPILVPADLHPQQPRFFHNTKKVLFMTVLRSNDTEKRMRSELYKINLDGTSLQKIELRGEMLIIEAIPSLDNQSIYLISSGAITHYSPLVKAMPHEMDIYAFDLRTKSLNKLTNYSSYDLNSLYQPDGTHLYFHSSDAMHQSAPFGLLNLKTSQVKFFSLSKREAPITTTPGFGDEEIIWGPSRISPDGESIIYIKPATRGSFHYELFNLNIAAKTSAQLTDLKSVVTSPIFFDNGTKIAFLKEMAWPQRGNPYDLMVVNADGSGLTKIILQV